MLPQGQVFLLSEALQRLFLQRLLLLRIQGHEDALQYIQQFEREVMHLQEVTECFHVIGD